MRKVLFLMISLLLMGLGAASVKAQVRIGGNTAPSAAAVLDLNASDAANLAKGGLVLPRVDLTSSTMQLTNGVANQTGTMVYNVTTTLGRIGVYYWNGNSWVLASLPSTSAADSGRYLISNGTTWVPANRYANHGTVPFTNSLGNPVPETWSIVASGTWTSPSVLLPGDIISVTIPGLTGYDICFSIGGVGIVFFTTTNSATGVVVSGVPELLVVQTRCYRPSA